MCLFFLPFSVLKFCFESLRNVFVSSLSSSHAIYTVNGVICGICPDLEYSKPEQGRPIWPTNVIWARL